MEDELEGFGECRAGTLFASLIGVVNNRKSNTRQLKDNTRQLKTVKDS